MPVGAGDIILRLSTTGGSAGNTLASTPAASLGKYVSTTALVSGAIENLIRGFSEAESESGITIYRCVFLCNVADSEYYSAIRLWLTSQQSGGANVSIGVDPTGVTALGSASAQAVDVEVETTAPAGVTFSAPTDYASGLVLGTLDAGECIAFWVRANVPAGASPIARDDAFLRTRGGSL